MDEQQVQRGDWIPRPVREQVRAFMTRIPNLRAESDPVCAALLHYAEHLPDKSGTYVFFSPRATERWRPAYAGVTTRGVTKRLVEHLCKGEDHRLFSELFATDVRIAFWPFDEPDHVFAHALEIYLIQRLYSHSPEWLWVNRFHKERTDCFESWGTAFDRR